MKKIFIVQKVSESQYSTGDTVTLSAFNKRADAEALIEHLEMRADEAFLEAAWAQFLGIASYNAPKISFRIDEAELI